MSKLQVVPISAAKSKLVWTTTYDTHIAFVAGSHVSSLTMHSVVPGDMSEIVEQIVKSGMDGNLHTYLRVTLKCH